MNFHIITIFPEMFDSYFNESILGRAQKEEKININIYDLRDYAEPSDKRRTVDDTPYGGGPGMVMMVEPIFKCVENIKLKIKNRKSKNKKELLVLLTSAKGKIYNQQKVEKIKNEYTDVIIICGRYEGVDERVAEFIADEEVSVGKYILTGGELPAMIIVDSISRLIEGVLRNKDSLVSESYNNQIVKSDGSNKKSKCNEDEKLDYPVYTRPAKFNNWEVPSVLQSGNHKEIEKWRKRQM